MGPIERRYVNADGTCGTCGLMVRACWCGKDVPPMNDAEGHKLMADWRLAKDLAAAEAEIERLREALRFYAERSNWIAVNPPGTGAPCWHDLGQRAKAALDG